MKKITARDIMNTTLHTVTPDMSVKTLARFLLKHQISGAPVMEKNRLVGIVTESDLIFRDASVHLPTVVSIFDAIIYLESPSKYEAELKKIIGGRVEDIMSREPVTITPDTEMLEMATIMREQRRHLLPVVQDGRVVGIVGRADLVRAILKEE